MVDCLLFGSICSGTHAIEEESVHGVTICVVSGLIAITCSAGLMLHARLPRSLIVTLLIIGGVEINPGPGLLANNGMLENLTLALLPVACLVGLPYVEQINAHECRNTCIVNLGTIHATHDVWCMQPTPRPVFSPIALLDAIKVA